MDQPVRLLLFGAGNRGADSYGRYALTHADEIKFIAVAEPDPIRREKFARDHAIPSELQFNSWQEALEAKVPADAVLNSTQDEMHHDSAIAALKAGYDMLLEKPIAPTLQETLEIIRTAEELGRTLVICHVLRFTDFFTKVNRIIKSGRLGKVVNISHSENVSYYHMAHSYVRGNWRNTKIAAPMILAKCCHDLDLLYWWMDSQPESLSSSGNLLYYRPENAPEGAPARCTDGCPVETSCPFYAPRIYRDNVPIKMAVSRSRRLPLKVIGYLSLHHPRLTKAIAAVVPVVRALVNYHDWPRNVITDDPTSNATVMEALRNGPYGRCVYHCDNDVVDHQVVNIAFKNGVTATLTMHGHSEEEGRTLRIDGSRATLKGKFATSAAWLEVHEHVTGGVERFEFASDVDQTSGHGGGDAGLMHHFVQVIRGEVPPLTSARDSLESHLMAFAAEESRLAQITINMDQFEQ
ncbi:MAG: Gfo/Idh/MocA family oxidoreductase, partial [Anaerolineaceae bacterium]|nr:Gfo/Idh/MocA family oxidoreductase [Anaerolineaceae bacterium]